VPKNIKIGLFIVGNKSCSVIAKTQSSTKQVRMVYEKDIHKIYIPASK